MKNTYENDSLNKCFQGISFLYSKILNLPSKLIKCFKDLDSNLLKKVNVGEMNSALDDYIKLNVFEKKDSKAFEFPNDNIELYEEPSMCTIEEYIDNIIKYKEEFECFIKLYEYLSNEYNKYYIIDFKKPNKLFDIGYQNIISKKQNEPGHGNLNIDLDGKLCNHVKNIFHYCFESILILSIDMNRESDKIPKVIEHVKANIERIKNYLSNLTHAYKKSFLYKITLNLISVNQLTDEWLWNPDNYSTNITRFLHMIINALTEYVLEFCRPLKYDFILFKKNEFALAEFNSNVLMNPDELLTICEKQHNDFKELFRNYLKTTKFMTDIKENITLSWKGEKKTIKDIYSNIESSISSPMFMFAFYDILYKFYIGTVLYYITVNRKSILTSSTNSKVIQHVLDAYNFHRHFKMFIEEYITQIKSYKKKIVYPSTINVLNELHIKLQVFEIFIIIPKKRTTNSVKINGEDIIKSIIIDVEKINENYQDLNDMYNNA